MTDHSPDGVTRSECKAEDAVSELRERAEKLLTFDWPLLRKCDGCHTIPEACDGYDNPHDCERFDDHLDDVMEDLKP